MNKLKLKIVTPERVLLESEIDSVSCPTALGQITILPGHIPLVSTLTAGEIIVRENGTEKYMVATGGVVEVRTGNETVVLADAAEPEEEVDEQRAMVARERARKIMAEQTLSEEEYAATAAALERSLARLRVAQKKKHRNAKTQIRLEG